MEERLDVNYPEEDIWDEFDQVARKVIESEAPETNLDLQDLEDLLRIKVSTTVAMYKYERMKR